MRHLRDTAVRRAGAEGGWALVTALILMVIMLSIGLASFAFVDQQQRESGIERTRETAFNFAEGTLTAQVFNLTGSKWPGKSAGTTGSGLTPVPTCTSASSDSRCPNAAALASLFNNSDTASGSTWQTQVRDNDSADHVGQTYYSDAITAGQPGYDANGDGKLWVRAQATAKGKTRTLVALVKVEQQQEDIPHNALLSGRVTISNNGNKVIIDTTLSGGSAPVTVRCVPALLELTPCLGHSITLSFTLADLTALLDKQIAPDLTVKDPSVPNALSPDALARLKAKAIADGTFFATCPSDVSMLAGETVWIDSGNCVYTANSDVNSQASPGALFVNGTINFGGTASFWGLIYGINPNNSSGTIVDVEGSATVQGGVIVDGQGTYIAGSKALNIVFRPQAFDGVKTFGSAGIIQNTWREIKP
jgi:Tfp pilus assembly protein PilX